MRKLYNKRNESILVPDSSAQRLIDSGAWSLTPKTFERKKSETREEVKNG